MTFIKRHLSRQPIPRRCTNKIQKQHEQYLKLTSSQLVNNTIYGTSCEIKKHIWKVTKKYSLNIICRFEQKCF